MHWLLVNHLKKFPLILFLSLFFPLLAAVGLIFQLKLIAFFVNGIVFLGLSTESYKNVLIIIFILILFRGILSFLGEVFSKELALKIKKIIRENLVQNLLQNHISNLHTGEVVNLLLRKIEALEDYFSKFIPQVFLSIFIPIFILIFVFPLDLLSAAIFFITAPLIPFFMILIGNYSEKVTKKQWHSLDKLSNFFLDSIRGIKTIIQFNQKDDHLFRIQNANNDFINKSMSVLKITFLSAFVLELVSTLSIAIIAVEIGLRLLYFQISFEQAFFILLIAPEFYLPLRNLGMRFHAAMSGVEAYRDITQQTKNKYQKETLRKSINLSGNISKVDINNLSFKYPSSDKQLFNNFNHTFESGKHYCIVGPNGSGKTTLFWLILNFLQPESGNIQINGLNSSDINPTTLFSKIGWLPQNPALFKGSIFDNIAVANQQLTVDRATELLPKVKLEEFVESLPQTIHTEIQEYGTTISSGQRQKIGLLRIFARNSSLILCDEITASLDLDAKKSILGHIKELGKEKILITIAHDLQTVKAADEILFLEADFPVLTGKFDFLISSNDRFRLYIDHYFGGA